MAHAESSAAAHHAHEHHITPKKTLYKVFGALVALTILTVLTAEFVDIGALNIPLALTIAGMKAALVVSIFMALKYDNRVNTLVFTLGTIFVVVFLAFTLFDTAFRGDLENVDAETVADRERAEEQLRVQEERLGPAALRITPADYEAGSEEGPSAGEAAASDTAAVDTSASEVANEAAAPAADTAAAGAASPEPDSVAADTSSGGGARP